MIEIPLVRCDGSKVRRRILRADEGVRTAFAFGDVVDVALVFIDDLVQMLTPVLADAEPMRFGAWIFQETRELGAVRTVARKSRWPAPVRWFHRNLFRAGFQLFAAGVQPISQRGSRVLYVPDQPWMKLCECRHLDRRERVLLRVLEDVADEALEQIDFATGDQRSDQVRE